MNQAIRSTWIVAIALFALIFGGITYVQFFAVDELKNNPWNNRALLQNFCNERGTIVVGGQPIAQSVPSTNGDTCKYQRQYNNPLLYSGITGFFSRSFGQTGLEKQMENDLTGNTDQLFYDRVVSMFLGNQPKGASVELTIDPKIQALAYSLIPDGQRGSIVVMNPKTGNIIAMVSKPSYDTNLMASHNPTAVAKAWSQLKDVPGISLYNSAATGDLYSPGSVFKLVDTAAALSSGKYNKDSVLPNPAALPLPGTNVSLPNYLYGGCSARTEADFAFALEQSCNTPFAHIALDLGQNAIAEQARKFGFGQDAGDQLKLDYTPSVFPSDLNQAQLAQSSVGQFDVKATPLQIALMTAAIANNGVQMKPNLIKALRGPDLRPYDEPKPEVLRTSTTPEISKQITSWMTDVVDKGIASGAQVPGVEVAGKTGTAELGAGGQNNSWFTGFAPANDPQVVVSIVMQDVDIRTGAQLTSPNAKKLIEAVLNK